VGQPSSIKRWFLSTDLSAFIQDILCKMRVVVLFYNSPERRRAFGLIRQVRKETGMLMADIEAYNIHMAVKRTEKVPGDIAEVGVFRGGSAKIISESKGVRALYLFDTFEGLPKADKIDGFFYKGQFAAPFERVKDYLSVYPDVHIYKGLFPKTADPILDKTFSFVHLDVDIYESTSDCLKFFYPRMSRGGIIISHDYFNSEGVKKAVDEFFGDKPEPVIEMPRSQCLIVKA
jgi:O-methyltransferase